MAGKNKPIGAFRIIPLLIFGMGILLCSLSFVLADIQFQRDLESRTHEVNSQNLNQALSLEQNLNRSFAQADVILQLMKAEIKADGSLGPTHIDLLRNFIITGIFNQIAVADSRGNLVYSAIPMKTPINISDRDHFLTHIKADSGKMYISAPRINQVAGAASMFLSRRLNDGTGNFAGVVSIGIALDYFSKLIGQLQPKTYNSFVLLAADGAFLARFPSADSVDFKAAFKAHPVQAKLNQGVSFGIYESQGAADGGERVGAFRRLSDYPAVVLVDLSKTAAFHSVTERRLDYQTWAGMFSLLLSSILLLLWWQVRKQYQTEETLVDSETRLNKAQSIAHVGDWVVALGSMQVWASAEAFRIYGIEHNSLSLTLKTIQQVVCKEDRTRMNKALKSLLEKNEKYDVEFKINRVDNGLDRTIHSIAELEYDQNGNPLRIVGIIQDITERKQTEEELRNTGDHLRKLIQYANAPIIVWNPDFIIIRFNKAFERLSGYTANEVLGKPVSVLYPEDRWTEIIELIEQSRSGLQWDSVEIPIRRKNGEERMTLWSSANIYAADAVTLTAVIAQGQDITERVQREQSIQRDAKLATRVQNALLSAPKPSDYIDIATVYKPFGYVGGDLYFLDWRYDDSLLRGFLVDATGHGLGTALHTASLHVLLREVNERDIPLSDAMRWLNRRAVEYFDEGTFAGALGFELDLQTRQLRWVCAGIPKTWVSTKVQKGIKACPGMCLGILEDETFDMQSMPVDVDDSFYFMTDGLADRLEQRTEKPPLDRYPEMVGLLRTLTESENLRDDATAVCIHVRALPQSLVRQSGWPRILRFNGYGDYQRLKGEVAIILAEVTGLPHSLHEVVVHEALANAMECRDGMQRQHKARLRFSKVGNRLIVRVKTSRMGFAGNAVLRRLRSHPEDMFSFGEDAAMGRGIPMMLSMSDIMMYNSEGTEVLLAWKL